LLFRSDENRSKQFAANVDQLLLVIAVAPAFSDDLLGRALAGAWSAGITPIILLNKVDLLDGLPAARAKLAPFYKLGVKIIDICAKDTAQVMSTILPLLTGQTSLLLGQSAMGKSTLLNTLVPLALAATREHSVALGAGKHTTTSTSLYWVGSRPDLSELEMPGTAIIDSPGFQEFGLQHIPQNQLAACMPDLKQHVPNCKFYNCTHLHEPGCGVLSALQKAESIDLLATEVSPRRHRIYAQLFEELGQQRWS
jgi:ribosome biogenesis GTPase